MTDAEQFEQFIMSPALDEFVQVNADKYRAKWRAMFAKAGTIKKTAARWSWNWPAFFLGGVWMLYRKMYAPGIFWLAVVAVLVIYPTLPGDLPGQDAMGSLPLILFLVAGMFGNGWYFQHVYKRVSGANGISSHKGVSWPSALAGGALYLAGSAAFILFAPSILADLSTQVAETPVAHVGEPTRSVAVSNPTGFGALEPWQKYAGAHPGEFAETSQLHPVFKERLGDGYEEFVAGLGVSSGMEMLGRYLVGNGCTQHACSLSGSFVSIDVIDGEIFAARMEEGWSEPRILTGADTKVTDEVISRYDEWRKEF